VLALWLAGPAEAHDYVVWRVTPSEGWCADLEVPAPGDVVELAPGRYPGGCVVLRGGVPAENEALVLRSLDAADPAVIDVPAGGFGLALAGPIARVERLRVEGQGDGVGVSLLADGQVVSGVTFVDLEIGVAAAPGDVFGATVLGSTFLGVSRPVVVRGPALGLVVVRQNLVGAGWAGAALEVGGGEPLVGENVIGPGLGTAISATGGLVTRNVVLGADTGVHAPGASILRNVVLDAPVAVAAGAEVVGNTVVGGSLAGDDVRGNAVVGPATAGDVRCDASCFVDLTGLDLSPSPAGPLVAAAEPDAGPDLCGRESASAAAGATDGPGPVTLDERPLVELCAAAPAPEPPEPLEVEPRGCGGGAAWLLAPIAALHRLCTTRARSGHRASGRRPRGGR
jgi:hypothetical protein